MTGNNLTDKEIRDLLKRRLLEQGPDDDPLTQKLTDMEAKLAFGTEAPMPSLQREKEFLNSLANKRTNFLKWLLPLMGLAITISVYLFVTRRSTDGNAITEIPIVIPVSELPKQKNDAVVVSDSAYNETRLILSGDEKIDSIKADTLEQVREPYYTSADAGIKVEYKPKKHDPKFVDAYDNIPVLTEYEMSVTKKFKERMIKQILKKDKNSWSYIPMSTGTFYGETVSLNPFYIATAEVTNNQYRTFLNDLLMQGRIDEYVKAVPDTSKWISDGRALFLKLQADSAKWPGSPEQRFEPMRKNYFWHPAYDSYPVLNVSREAAKLYCDWLTKAVNDKIMKEYPESKWNSLLINDLRIPQDVEWMMAAKGGNNNAEYPWTKKVGATNGPQNSHGCYLANFCIRNYKEEVSCPNKKFPNAYNSAGTVSHDYIFVAPVMSYNPNDYNLFCLSGNVAEMVWVSEKGKAGTIPGTKGGSWGSDAEHIKIEAKDEYAGITEPSIYIGFRPVFTSVPKKK